MYRVLRLCPMVKDIAKVALQSKCEAPQHSESTSTTCHHARRTKIEINRWLHRTKWSATILFTTTTIPHSTNAAHHFPVWQSAFRCQHSPMLKKRGTNSRCFVKNFAMEMLCFVYMCISYAKLRNIYDTAKYIR